MEAASDDIFRIDGLTHADGVVKASLSINPDSPIFKGHFPGQPVVPGACMLQVVKEILESTLKYPIQLKKAGNLKFIGMIDPAVTTSLQLELSHNIESGLINVTGKLSDGDRVCFKMSAAFIQL